MNTTAESPVVLTLDAPLEVARWRPLVHWILAIPQYIVVYALQLVLTALTIVSFFTILFTKRIPEPIFGFMVLVHRYQWRVNSYILWMRESYPPFDFQGVPDDPGMDPARVSIWRQEEYRRLMPLVKWLLAIPHFIVLLFVFIGAFFVAIYGFFAVLITGRWPEGAREFIIGANRWYLRVQAYVALLTDVYPPFSLA
jgi:roadblock/LC7 domain-containing protein